MIISITADGTMEDTGIQIGVVRVANPARPGENRRQPVPGDAERQPGRRT